MFTNVRLAIISEAAETNFGYFFSEKIGRNQEHPYPCTSASARHTSNPIPPSGILRKRFLRQHQTEFKHLRTHLRKLLLISHTGVAIGVHWDTSPLGAYTVTQNSAKNALKHIILTPKIQKFSGQTPSPWGGNTPSHPSPLKCPHYN